MSGEIIYVFIRSERDVRILIHKLEAKLLNNSYLLFLYRNVKNKVFVKNFSLQFGNMATLVKLYNKKQNSHIKALTISFTVISKLVSVTTDYYTVFRF